MDPRHIDRFAKSLSSTGTRRSLVPVLAALPLGVTLTALLGDGPDATAKTKDKDLEHGSGHRRHRRKAEHAHQTGKDKGTHKKNTCHNCCRANGSPCTKKSNRCTRSLCQRSSTAALTHTPDGGGGGAPLTIEAVWTEDRDHDTFLFVPNEAGSTVPSPWIDYSCNPADSGCEDNVYPFACVSQDATGPGNEITTVRTLLAGTYEYWIEVDFESPAGDITVNLKNIGGTVVRSWRSPPNPDRDLDGTSAQMGWHVFNFEGGTGAVTSVNETIDGHPVRAHNPSTEVCPG
jgi:hypothetical protein